MTNNYCWAHVIAIDYLLPQYTKYSCYYYVIISKENK